ncbi:MAG: amidohydrolase [Phycisphaerae bacterium]|nr:amidohydrolase [Phycisphaerae bacterium]
MPHAVSPPIGSLNFYNARVYTMDAASPRANAITLHEGRIESVGRAGAQRSIDLRGATVLPGLIDSHLHLELGGQSLLRLELSAARNRSDFERLVAERHASLAPGTWLIGGGWNEDAYPGPELPDASWLRAAGTRPAVCWRMDQHACVVNEAVLALLRASNDLRQDPPGGRIVRDAHGTPTGLLQEAAAWQLVQPLVPSPPNDDRKRAVLAAHAHLASYGITSAGSMEYERIVRDAIAPQRDAFSVRMRITLLDRAWPLDCSFATSFAHDDRLAIIGMKAFIDGTLGSRTARMLDDYADAEGNRGLFVELAERGLLREWIACVRDAGLSPSMHAIGDEAARAALDALDEPDALDALDSTARIEHAQTIHPDDIHRFRGRFASMQPLHKAYDARSALARLGAARMRRFFPFRALLHAGARLAFGSDWPIVSPNPIAGMRAVITGRDVDEQVCRPEDNLGVHAALVGYTSEAAACLGMSDAGALRPGFRADCTILDRDPYACDWVRTVPRVLATIMGGRYTFVHADFADRV